MFKNIYRISTLKIVFNFQIYYLKNVIAFR